MLSLKLFRQTKCKWSHHVQIMFKECFPILFVHCLMLYFCTGSMFAAQRPICFRALPKCMNQLNVINRLGKKTLTVSVSNKV